MDFTARIDGRRTPKDAENIGRKAGAAGAEGFDETWSKGYEDSLTKAGQDSLRRWRKNGENDGTIYGREIGRTMKKFLKQAEVDVAGLRMRPGFMDDFARSFDDAGLAARDMQTKLIELNRSGDISNDIFEAGKVQVDDWAEAQRQAAIESNNHRDAIAQLNNDLRDSRKSHDEATLAVKRQSDAVDKLRRESMAGLGMDLLNQKQLYDDVRKSVDRHTKSVNRSTEATKKQGLAWSDIPHNGRQVILITTAIAAAAEEIAVLGSAAGAGIIALGGAFSQFAVGGVATAAVFNRLNKDLEDLPANLRPVAEEFQNFKGVFGEVADTIAGAAFQNMDGVFDSLRESVSSLNPAFAKVGDSVGILFRDFAKAVKPGSEALADIEELVENSADGFDQLARTAGKLGGALVRSFNRAQPLVEDLYGWIDTLVTRFDDFTQSRDFDTWISRAQSVFGALGPLIDATGRALNDLVTPQSTARTIEFLDSLTAFMPDLTRLLNTVGALDIFGLAAQALAEFGEAMRPLAEPMQELAEEISRLAGGALTGLATGFGAIATAAAPLVDILATILGAIPTEAIEVAAVAVVGLASAFTVLKAAASANALLTSLGGFTGALTSVTTAGGKASKALAGLGGKAGAIGLVATGVAVGLPMLKEFADTVNGYAENARRAAGTTTDLGDAVRLTLSGNEMFSKSAGDMRVSLEQLVAVQASGPFNRWISDLGQANRESAGFALALNELDKSISGLPIDDAIAQFSAYADSVNASDTEVTAMLKEMPLLEAQLREVADASGGVATQQEIVALALGGTATGAWQAGVGMRGAKNEANLLSTAAGLTGEQIDTLADKIRNFGNTELTAREAARQFEAGIDELTQSIITNGTTLDISTEKGRANEAAIDSLAQSVLEHSATTLENTGSQKAANDVIAKGRDELIKQLEAFNITGAEADAYVGKLGLIPADVRTKAVLEGVQTAMNQINEITKPRTLRITAFLSGVQGALNQVSNIFGSIPGYAAGTVTNGPQHALIGEAGPEAVVPLNRPLSQVDPSVRWLSAIAQGKQGTQAMASGGMAGGRSVNFEPGSIVVQAAIDPRQTAFEVADIIAERIAS